MRPRQLYTFEPFEFSKPATVLALWATLMLHPHWSVTMIAKIDIRRGICYSQHRGRHCDDGLGR